jgi:hypothetical protein
MTFLILLALLIGFAYLGWRRLKAAADRFAAAARAGSAPRTLAIEATKCALCGAYVTQGGPIDCDQPNCPQRQT